MVKNFGFFFFLFFPLLSHGGELSVFGKNAAEIFFRDSYRIITSPLKISRENLPETAGIVGFVLLSSSLDRRMHDTLDGWESHDLDRFHQATEPLGRTWAISSIGAVVFTGGLITGNSAAIRSGAECAEASFYATSITVFLKNATGRLRPGSTGDPFRFYPFRKGNAFPSSHSVQAFTAAAVLSEYTPDWADWLLYTVSSAVAAFDMYKNRHWTSDIIAGSLLGFFLGKAIVRWHERMRKDEALLNETRKKAGIGL